MIRKILKYTKIMKAKLRKIEAFDENPMEGYVDCMAKLLLIRRDLKGINYYGLILIICGFYPLAGIIGHFFVNRNSSPSSDGTIIVILFLGREWYSNNICIWFLEHAPISVFVENLYGIISQPFLMFISFKTIISSSDVKRFVVLLDQFEFGIPSFARHRLRRLHLLTYACFYGISVAGAGYLLFGKFFAQLYCKTHKEEYGLVMNCGYATYVWYPIETNMWILEQFRIITHSICLWYAYIPVAFIGLSTRLLVEYVIIRIEHLQLLLNRLDASNNVKLEKDLVKCFHFHQNILETVHALNSFMSIQTVLLIMCTGFILGVSVYSIAEKILKGYIFSIGYMVISFLMCYGGQRLLDKSNELRLTLYYIPWYNFPNRLQKCVLLMLMKTNRDIQITSAVGNQSLKTYFKIVKIAYSFYTFMGGS